MFRPRIAVTLGDPRGIGPEVAERALARLASGASPADFEVVFHEPAATLRTYARPMSDADAGAAAARSIEAAVEGALGGHFHAVGKAHGPGGLAAQ